MADENNVAGPEDLQEMSKTQELELLKERANRLGITYHPNIGLDTLRERVRVKLLEGETGPKTEAEDGDEDDENGEDDDTSFRSTGEQTGEVSVHVDENVTVDEEPEAAAPKAATPRPPKSKAQLLREKVKREQLAMVRIRISCMNPSKANLPGEIFAVGNEYVGMVKKYVPYQGDASDSYHVPKILYNYLVNKRFLHIAEGKRDKRTNVVESKSRMAREFAIEVLPPLTKEELRQLAQAQMARHSIDRDDEDTGGLV